MAAALDALRRTRSARFRTLVNEVLRAGLRQMRSRPVTRQRFRTRTVDLGDARLASLDSVADALAVSEGEAFR